MFVFIVVLSLFVVHVRGVLVVVCFVICFLLIAWLWVLGFVFCGGLDVHRIWVCVVVRVGCTFCSRRCCGQSFLVLGFVDRLFFCGNCFVALSLVAWDDGFRVVSLILSFVGLVFLVCLVWLFGVLVDCLSSFWCFVGS